MGAGRWPATAGWRHPDHHHRHPPNLPARPHRRLRADPPGGLPRSGPGVLTLLPVVGQRSRRIRSRPSPRASPAGPTAGQPTTPARPANASPSDHRNGTRRPDQKEGPIMTTANLPDRTVIELEYGITVYPARVTG